VALKSVRSEGRFEEKTFAEKGRGAASKAPNEILFFKNFLLFIFLLFAKGLDYRVYSFPLDSFLIINIKEQGRTIKAPANMKNFLVQIAFEKS